MAKGSRTRNSLYNFITGIGGQILTTILEFLVRTVFISILGKTFLGVNGLFSNILTMLSLAELGVGSAIVFKLYDPIAKQDQHRIIALMNFYKKAYMLIGMVITVAGITLIPLLPVIIKNYQTYEKLQINLVFVYALFLTRTVSSYLFFAYKTALIKANQQEYLLNIISYIFTIMTAVVRIVVMFIYPKFETYILISIVFVILQNIAYATKANKLFPYLKTNNREIISKSEQKEILKDCGALVLYKINGVVLKGTDNIILSSFLGLEAVGMYSNYYLFYKTLDNVFRRVFESVAHSIGDLHATNKGRKEYCVFNRLLIITAILASTTFIGVSVVGDEFIQSWVGKEWVFDQPVALLIGLELYTLCFRHFLARYRTGMGLFRQAKFRPVAGMLINLIVSLVMVQRWGVCGVLFGTIIADWTTFMWYDPIIIHKYGFKNSSLVKEYFLNYIKYFFATIVVLNMDKWLCSIIVPSHGWISIIIHSLICGITAPVFILLISWKREERKYLTDMIKKVVNRTKKRI